MALILLDTSVILDHLNGRDGRTEYLDDLIEQGHLLACCPVNFTEVYAGLRPGEEVQTKKFLNSLEFFTVTTEIAAQSGLLRRDWRQKGHTLSYADVTISAVALMNRLALLTDNRKHSHHAGGESFPAPKIDQL